MTTHERQADELTEHRDVLYKGYVNQYNTIQAALEKADVSKANPHYSEWGELKRRETWAHNGVLLHELYFENIGGKGTKPGAKTTEPTKCYRYRLGRSGRCSSRSS